MRTPNVECVICKTPLYRRPYELKTIRYVACMTHREQAKKLYGTTAKQEDALKRGRGPHLVPRPRARHKDSTKDKIADSNKRYYESNPQAAKARGEKIRGEKHYKWRGGLTRLNHSIRQMTEMTKWTNRVKARDRECKFCKSLQDLHSHHIVELADIIETYNIKTREDAQRCDALWSIDNGITVCFKCHCKVHGKTPPSESANKKASFLTCQKCLAPYHTRPSQIGRSKYCSKSCKSSDQTGSKSSKWRGGNVTLICKQCQDTFETKPASVKTGRKYCSRKCVNDSKRKKIHSPAETPEGTVSRTA